MGALGTVLLSADGKTWTAASSGTTSQLNAVRFGVQRFSAVGEAGANLTAL